MWSSFATVFSLLGCMIVSSYYRQLRNVDEKKLFGASFGCFILFVVCGEQIIHPMFITLVNILIIMQADRKIIHIKSISISFTYLVLMHVGFIKVSKATIDVQKIITLRLVGLCFELNTSYLINNFVNLKLESETLLTERILSDLKNVEEIPIIPDLKDLLAYTFHFIGILKGPYYTWRTFNDYFELSLENFEAISPRISRRVDNIPVIFVMYIWLNIFFPLNVYIMENSPYDLMALWCCYNLPRLIILYLNHYMITALCEGACIEAGFGIYPNNCSPLPGFGPSRNFELLKQMKRVHSMLPNEKYEINAVKISGEYLIFSDPRMRKSLKYCDMTTQYWFWANITRRIPMNNKYLRLFISLIFWFIWSEISISNVILLITLFLYVYVEDFYSIIFDEKGNYYRSALYIGTSLITKMICFIYLTPTLYGLDGVDVIAYYFSIRWSFHILLIALLVSGFIFRIREYILQKI